MQAAHADRLVGEPQRRVRGAEPLARVTRPLPAEVHEPVERDAHLFQVRTEEVPHEAGLEVIASGRDRCVRGEDDSGPRDEPRLLEGHAARGAELADSLDRAEKAVALVEMEDAGDHA